MKPGADDRLMLGQPVARPWADWTRAGGRARGAIGVPARADLDIRVVLCDTEPLNPWTRRSACGRGRIYLNIIERRKVLANGTRHR